MKSKFAFLLSLIMSLNLFLGVSVSAVTAPGISKDNISVRVGTTVNVPFTYGDSASSVNLVLSNLKIDAVVSGNVLNITGLSEGVSYVTMNFNDGSSDSIKVTVTDKTTSSTISKDTYIEMKKGNSKSIYIDLDAFDATRATITYESDYVSVNKTTFNTSGNLKITTKKLGSTSVKVSYNSGDVVYYDISIKNNKSSNYSDYDMEIGETVGVYIDLDIYDASRATINYDSSYISVNKTTFNNSGYLNITAKKKGFTEIEIKYGSNDYEYVDVYIERNSSSESHDYDESIEIKQGSKERYYVDLSIYNASKATITCDDIVLIDKSVLKKSGYIEIMGISRGDGEIRIKYDTGDVIYISVDVIRSTSNENEPNVSLEDITVEKDESVSLYVYLGNASKATLSMKNSNATVSKSSLSESGEVKIIGKTKGTTELRITFSDNTKFVIPVEVTYTNYKEPTADLERDILVKNENSVLTLYTGSENTSVTVTISNPEILKLDSGNFSKYNKNYTYNLSKNKSKEIKITAVSEVGETEISVKYPEGKTYIFTLSIVKNKSEETDGFNKNGDNFKLNNKVTVDKNILNNGYINGYDNGTFGILNNITREEFGVLLSRILNSKVEVSQSDYFEDVTANWSKNNIAELVSMGIVERGSHYNPTQYITRYEVAEMLYNALDLSDFSTTCPLLDLSNSERDRKMAQCYNAGIINGFPDGTFGGNNNITRTEVVVMLNRIFYSNIQNSKYNKFSDLMADYWGYQDILKATIN